MFNTSIDLSKFVDKFFQIDVNSQISEPIVSVPGCYWPVPDQIPSIQKTKNRIWYKLGQKKLDPNSARI